MRKLSFEFAWFVVGMTTLDMGSQLGRYDSEILSIVLCFVWFLRNAGKGKKEWRFEYFSV